MRPIDADALEKKLQEQRELYVEMGMKGAEHLLVHDFLRFVWEAPTIDPVRHGKWEVAGNTTHYYTCSVCGKPGDGFDNYCRSCGAKMDAELEQAGGKERVNMDICGDNRFEIIERAKKHLLDATNIDTSADEMKVLDDFLYRCWQMGWLDRYDTADTPQIRRGKWVRDETDKWRCSACGAGNNYAYEWSVGGEKLQDNYCPKCGAKMDADADADGKR